MTFSHFFQHGPKLHELYLSKTPHSSFSLRTSLLFFLLHCLHYKPKKINGFLGLGQYFKTMK